MPAMPGGTWIGIRYSAAPLSVTRKLPGGAAAAPLCASARGRPVNSSAPTTMHPRFGKKKARTSTPTTLVRRWRPVQRIVEISPAEILPEAAHPLRRRALHRAAQETTEGPIRRVVRVGVRRGLARAVAGAHGDTDRSEERRGGK